MGKKGARKAAIARRQAANLNRNPFSTAAISQQGLSLTARLSVDTDVLMRLLFPDQFPRSSLPSLRGVLSQMTTKSRKVKASPHAAITELRFCVPVFCSRQSNICSSCDPSSTLLV